MSARRVIAIVVAVLLLIPAVVVLIGGTVLTVAHATARDDDGFYDVRLDGLQSETAAVTSEDIDLEADPGPPEWLIDLGDVTVELRVRTVRPDVAIFVGIAPADDVDAFLDGVARDEVNDLDGRRLELARIDGSELAPPPGEETFWEVSTAGSELQTLRWDLAGGRWVVVVMNADGSPGVAAELEVGAKAGFLLPLAIGAIVLSLLVIAGAVALIVRATRGGRHAPVVVPAPEPAPVPSPDAGPVRLRARVDPDLSPWLWLVKWFLAIPHFVVLFFLWLALIVLTVVAGFAILFTGRYPQGIFDFNHGVLRWTWRVSYYATTGGIGTDRYPPFSLGAEPDYPATLEIEAPGPLSRGLVLVKWWLLAMPHYLILAIVFGGGWGDGRDGDWGVWPGGLVGLLVLFVGVSLLFRRTYPAGLFDLVVGLNRWMFRVIAYATLMTDRYPPFSLDQGGEEPGDPRTFDPSVGPTET